MITKQMSIQPRSNIHASTGTCNKYSSGLGGIKIAEGLCDKNGWLVHVHVLLYIIHVLESVLHRLKGITKQLLTGIRTAYDSLDLQSRIILLAYGLEQHVCHQV